MADDLQRFPTPQEAFGRPPTSAAYEQPSNMSPLPPPQRHTSEDRRSGTPPVKPMSGVKAQHQAIPAQQGQRNISNHRPLRPDGRRVVSAGAYGSPYAGAPNHSSSSLPGARNGSYGSPGSYGAMQGTYNTASGTFESASGAYAPQTAYNAPPPATYNTPPGTYGTPPGPPPPGPQHAVAAPKTQSSAAKTTDLRSLFDEVDRHKRGYLTERELSKALVNADYTLFDQHTVRLMMKMFDRDGDGAIYFAEFGQLWRYLYDWRQVFERFDTSANDSISLDEFIRALAAFGYNLTSTCLLFLFNAGSKLNRQGQREMSFDMFVQSCISLKSITDTFKKYDTERNGYVTMSFEDFLMEVTKLH